MPEGDLHSPDQTRSQAHWQWLPAVVLPVDRGKEEGLIPLLPYLRTGRAVLPHPALRLMVLPPRGLTGLSIGCLQAEQPLFGKEGIGPAVMIRTPSAATTARPLAQGTAQAHADPAVH